MEEQEAANVRGAECSREAAEGDENPQEENGNPLPPNYGVNQEAQLDWKQLSRALDTGGFQYLAAMTLRHALKNLTFGKEKGTNTVT